MTRVKEITTRQGLFNDEMAELEQRAEITELKAETIAALTCNLQPIEKEWSDADKPARATLKQIATLEAVRDRTPEGPTRNHLNEALEALKDAPAPWVKQLKVQALLTDAFDSLRSNLEDFSNYVVLGRDIARKAGVKYVAHDEFQAAVRVACEALLAELVVLACPKDNQRGIVAYATRAQSKWLKNSALLFKRAGLSTRGETSYGHRGSDYFYLLDHIKTAGVFEKQAVYTWPDSLDDLELPAYLTPEVVSELLSLPDEKARVARLSEIQEEFLHLRDAPVDENTVAIDETIVETE